MTDVALAYSPLVTNASSADPAGTSVGDTNQGVIAAAVPELTVLRIVNGAAASSFVLEAGTQPLAIASGQGSLTVALTASTTYWIGPIESGRFLQSDGSLKFTVTKAVTATAFKVPRH